MGQLRKLNVSAINRHTPISNKQYRSVPWHGDSVLVRPLLTLDETFAFTARVMDLCADEGGRYLPELAEMAFRQTILEMYAVVELPDDIDQRYYYLFGSDLYDTVEKTINGAQAKSLRNVIDLWLKTVILT